MKNTTTNIEAIAEDVLKIIQDLGGCDATDEWDKGYDGAIDSVYDEIANYFSTKEARIKNKEKYDLRQLHFLKKRDYVSEKTGDVYHDQCYLVQYVPKHGRGASCGNRNIEIDVIPETRGKGIQNIMAEWLERESEEL